MEEKVAPKIYTSKPNSNTTGRQRAVIGILQY